jgi:hypothetical protein
MRSDPKLGALLCPQDQPQQPGSTTTSPEWRSIRVSGVLARLEGHLELGLKVLWDRDLIAQEAAGHDARELVELLRPHATAVRVVSPIGERMILNAAFLVAREQEAAFDAKVRSLAARFELLTFQYTGPWAPYHFADIRLGLRSPRPP